MPPSKPAPGTHPKLFKSPNSQPLRIRGNVSQLGTFSFQPSITVATIMAAHTKVRGQLFRMYDMELASSHVGRCVSPAAPPRSSTVSTPGLCDGAHYASEPRDSLARGPAARR